jgi:alanyl aminopeptidase
LLGALLIACGGPSSPAPLPSPAALDPNLAPASRLGDASEPRAYQLKLRVDPGEPRFEGEVIIDIELHQELHTLWLHQKNLKITRAVLERGNQEFELEPLQSDGDQELLGLRSSETLDAGRARLRIEFGGKLGNMQGLFRQLEHGRWYAYTDFEATDARAAFPCYDDPRFKVPWDVTLEVPAGNRAFSNAPEIASEQKPDGTRLVRFAPTRPLPSYLVAMAVGPFDLIEGKASSTPLRVIAPKGQATHGRFVLENTGQWMRYLEDYLGMPMPFPKLDFIAVPRFGGAMENPGLVTFSSNILLTGPAPSDAQKRRAAGVTTHELAHMWFGNLVTPHYWDDLWLNEAFATWLSDKAVAQWQPAKARDILDIADKSTAYAIDHNIGGRVVREPIKGRNDIRAAFDAITYRKGGALLTMLEGWLGEKVMQKGVRHYLHAHAGGNARAHDLIASMHQTAPKKQTDRILRSFLEQPGIPVVSLGLRCDSTDVFVELKETRYIPLSMQPFAHKARGQSWKMPVCIRYPADEGTTKKQCTMIDTVTTTMTLETSGCPAWVLPNDQESGYYHYLLPAKDFAALGKAELDPREELGMVHSVAAALRSGGLQVGEALALLEPYASSTSVHVQQVLVPLLYELHRSVIGKDEARAFAELVRRWYGARVAALGLATQPGEADADLLLRPVLIQLLADLGDDRELQDKARERVQAWLKKPTRMDMSLLDSLLQAAAIRGDAALAARYVEVLSSARDLRHSAVLIGALHAFRNPDILDSALDRSLPRHLTLPNLAPVLVRAMGKAETRPTLLRRLFAGREEILSAGMGAKTKNRAQRNENFEQVAPLFASLCDEEGKNAAMRFAGEEFDAQSMVASIEGCMNARRVQSKSARAAFAP